jgi:ABC-type oligopeptide transport system substrate-binding subunit
MRVRVILPVIALLGLGLAACGEDGPNQTGSTTPTNPPPASSSAPTNPTTPSRP